jgi:DNA replicative helicase MCM subunit Mcm2 (Cdc46/Mcm family)
LIKSICPSIFGHELPKTGQLLSLFGGTDYRLKNKGEFSDFMICQNDKNNHNDEEDDDTKGQPTIRPDIHLLMVGDPGLGKS